VVVLFTLMGASFDIGLNLCTEVSFVRTNV
jgi:hypothetical protein